MKYKDKVTKQANECFIGPSSDPNEIDGHVYTLHGIVIARSDHYNEYSTLDIVFGGNRYQRCFGYPMTALSLNRAAHKFARDVAEGRVQ